MTHYAKTKLPKAHAKCPTCRMRLEIDIEPFKGTVYYCRTCQKIIKTLPIEQREHTERVTQMKAEFERAIAHHERALLNIFARATKEKL